MARFDLLMFLALAVTVPEAAFAAEATWSTPTSAPDGHAVCVLTGSIKSTTAADAQITLAPTTGEAVLQLTVGPKKSLTAPRGVLAAGTQPGCDIFPNVPTGLTLPLTVPAVIFGILDLHAHPGSDCGAASVSEGTVTIDASLAKTKLKVVCDADAGHANIQLLHDVPALTQTGLVEVAQVTLANHGPGTAHGVRLHAKLPKGFFFRDAVPSQGHCLHDWRKRRVECTVGDVGPYQAADVDIVVVPIKEGKQTTSFALDAENAGDLLPDKAKIASDVAKGSSAILSVELKCKGAAGTVTIDPNAAGGTTTCTCPDPNDATREVVQCIEIYDKATAVTLTPAATKGAFNKWTGACAGNPAACNVQLDPAAANPDKSATGKFK